jgi:hypothetical protein
MDELNGLYLIDKEGECRGIIEENFYSKNSNRQIIYYKTLDNEYRKGHMEIENFKIYAETAKLKSDRYKIIKNKGISHIYHFSPIKNTSNILEHGLLSREYADRLGVSIVTTDPLRLDGELNKISASISFPNYKMRYKLEMDGQELIIYDINPRILLTKLDTQFYHTNAASSIYYGKDKREYTTNQAFKAMYTPYGRNENLRPHYTTDPQAEILVDTCIPTYYIENVISNYYDEDTKRLCLEKGFSYQTDASLYRPRIDWMDW